MRRVIEPQMKLGEQAIADIKLDPKSRDDIPQILRGLQHIYTTPELREPIFTILEEVLPERQIEGKTIKADPNNGRPGMTQWQILVLGVLRLGLNADYDRIHELANEHKTLRKMLGHSDWADDKYYNLQTLKDNLRLFTPEILDRLNRVVVQAGHKGIKKKLEDGTVGRCDSFVVETDVHFPTDINLLLDAIRKVIEISAELSRANNLPGWRQYRYHQRLFKRQYRIVQRLKHSTSKSESKRKQKEQEIQDAHRTYLDLAEGNLTRADQTRQQISPHDPLLMIWLIELNKFMQHGRRQINQIDRRVLQGKRIPHDEKVFSLFQPHTEWISKGKAGVPVELGLRVCVMEDRDRFILHHRVMVKTTDDKVAFAMVGETKQKFPTLRAVSMDKGFYSPANQEVLKSRLDCVVLPKKGRLSQADKVRESGPEFVSLRKQHSAVESAINALEVHGLDKCLDHGLNGFKRYVAMAVVARNIQRLGAVLRQQDQEATERKRGSYKRAA
ncbi:ISNCY family transposase [Desulfopila sp. IMCC35006]|uniref:ISNCY family transposase n=1 Tax=Desulfopila sp. IMCC35006 TaxID=2569542 RepID=UPI0010ACB176|nr:ISNCY family transposase [Desulfopila sp. IMCC35006]TKB23740.1 ISNCY family transposase [Desulfopila sp. IMCC35006]